MSAFISFFLLCFSFAAAYHGKMTYYRTGITACGFVSQDGDPIVATSRLGQAGFNCGDKISITYNGKTTYAYVADHCAACDDNHIDVSPGVFMVLAPLGEVNVDWQFSQQKTFNVGAGSSCSQEVLCTGSAVYCSGTCQPLPLVDAVDILAGGPGFEFQQCSGVGFPEPIKCPGDFECLNMGQWGRPDMGQCIHRDSVFAERPSYVQISGDLPVTFDPVEQPPTTTKVVVPTLSSTTSSYFKEESIETFSSAMPEATSQISLSSSFSDSIFTESGVLESTIAPVTRTVSILSEITSEPFIRPSFDNIVTATTATVVTSTSMRHRCRKV